MARSVAASVENNFVRGIITEASGLNFPENACTEAANCHFDLTGSVRRRGGLDFENGYVETPVDRTQSAITTYLWKTVSGAPGRNLMVTQIGNNLYFSDATNPILSAGILAATIDLTDFSPAGADEPRLIECQFSSGHGLLFVTHPILEPFWVLYDADTDTATGVPITIEIRDFIRLTDNLDPGERPTTLDAEHAYNLVNQGWPLTDYAIQTSSTSITPGTGSKVFTVTAGGPWATGDLIYIWSKGNTQQGASTDLHYMNGKVDTYSGTTLTVTVTSFGPDTGAGAKTDWNISNVPSYVDWFEHAMGCYPSNQDVWWLFKDAQDIFNPRKTAATATRGSTLAPNGHFILEAFNQDRSTVSGGLDIDIFSSEVARPSTSAFFAGRVFYSGVDYADFGSNIYFSQILKVGQYTDFGKCYQANDPTSEDLFDLLPNDGGVISIPEAGQILKLISMQGGLVVFASKGIWLISGSTGTGFLANDYTVRQISTIRALSPTSFVDVGGFPAWWSAEGIYILQPDQTGLSVSVKSLTDATILTAYETIPDINKKYARGFFDLVSKKIHWLFRYTLPSTVEGIYDYEGILIYDVRTTAFNLWTVEGDVKIHAVISVEQSGGYNTSNQVVAGADTVVDGSANNVITYELAHQVTTPVFKYLITYDNSGTQLSVAEENNFITYSDWFQYDLVGTDYISYFISGYKVHGQAQRKFQSNYIYIFSQEIPSEFNFQAIWDYANTGDSGSWSSQSHQTVRPQNTQYNIQRHRLKIRGEGLALQFKVYSESGQPFNIVGWSTFETGNASI